MNDNTAKILTELADKFGTTVAHLWGVLVRQAYISAIGDVLLSLALLVVTVIWYRIVRRHTTRVDNGYGFKRADWDDEMGVALAWILCGFFLGATIIAGVLAVQSVVTAIFNPEYYALSQIFSGK